MLSVENFGLAARGLVFSSISFVIILYFYSAFSSIPVRFV